MCSWSASAASTTVVISQVYGAGGNSGATYLNDFVELFNKSSSPVSLNGWSVQYASSTGAFNGGANNVNLPNVTLQPGHYFLVQVGSGGSVGAALPTPDATGTVNMSGTSGKVALANTTTALGTVTLPNANVVDFVGFGSAANVSEGGAPAAFTTDNTKSVLRNNGGCTDSDNNAADFTEAAVTPRNTSSPANNCGGSTSGFIQVETKADGTGVVVPAQSLVAGNSLTVYAILRDASTNFVSNVAADSWSLGKSGTVASGDLVPSGDLKSAVLTGHGAGTALIVANLSTANSVPSGTITITATTPTQVRVETAADGSGNVVSNQTILAGNSIKAYAIRRDQYTNFVDNVAASAWSLQNITGSVLGTDLTPAGDSKSATFTGNGTGSATIHATSGALTPIDSGILNVTSLPPATVVISQVYGGGGNSGATYTQDFVELFNRTANPVSISGWSLQYTSSQGTSFTSGNVAALPSVSIPAYSYYLVGLSNNTSGTGGALPTVDFTAQNINMSQSDGKIVLANTATALGVANWPDTRILDMVGYGGANNYEGAGPAPTLSSTLSAQRNNAGCTDTDNNNTDFTAATPSPRNSTSGQNICPSQTPPTIGSIPNQAEDSSAPIGPITFDVNDQQTPPANLTLSATSSNPTLLPNANITFGGAGIVRNVSLNPVSGQTGTAQITVTVTDSDNMTAQSVFNLFVGGGPQLGVVFADNFDEYPNGPGDSGTQTLSFIGDTQGGFWHTHSGTSYQIYASNGVCYVSTPPTNTEDISATLTNAPFTTSSGTILYVGAKITETSLPTTANGEYFLHLKDLSTSNFFCRLFANTNNSAAGKFRLGLSNKTTTGPSVQFPVDLDPNTAYSVVMRYKVGVGVSTLWVNPTSINDTSVTATDVITPGEIDMIAIREPGTTNTPSVCGSQTIDNLIISTSFNDVVTLTPLPPTLTAVRGASSLTITWPTNNNNGFVLQSASTVNATTWNPVGGVTTSGANYTVTIPFTSTPAYFRLKK